MDGWMDGTAERLTGSSRAAVQRHLARLEARDMICELTGQGRFRIRRAALPAKHQVQDDRS
jgi:DNA-binding MarR family transcriptional regulator